MERLQVLVLADGTGDTWAETRIKCAIEGPEQVVLVLEPAFGFPVASYNLIPPKVSFWL